MKRIFLIGNGFDLAHGLPTSYNDLVTWYGDRIISNLKRQQYSRDNFFEANLSVPMGSGPFTPSQIYDCPTDFNKLLESGLAKSKNNLFSDLLAHYKNRNWVDIENFYFESLKALAEVPKGKMRLDERVQRVADLNDQFLNIQNLLSEYLSTLPKNVAIIPEFLELFESNEPTDKSLFLTFNYTNSLRSYFDLLKNKSFSEIINIHGELDKSENPIIFGYGDQHDEVYPILENFNENEFLRFIKYPKYTLSNGFQKLASFINVPNERFDVNIIGHSCGLSDRTLLREILENDNCHRIYIYHYPDIEDFGWKATELTRHFSNKIDYLKKVQPFNASLLCPQIQKTPALH